jgi:hypothetical protein
MSEHTLKLHSISATSSTPSTESSLDLIDRYERQTEALRRELQTQRQQETARARAPIVSPHRARERG